MGMRAGLVLGAVAAVILLAGCASAPASDEARRSAPQHRTASGVIASPSGDVSARFEAEVLIPATQLDGEGAASPVATVEFFDFTLPYDRVSVGGSLYPRGDDECFDAALRSGGGEIVPDAAGSASAKLPFDAEGYELYELVLHLNYTQVDPGTTGCMEPVVARAPLAWEESVRE